MKKTRKRTLLALLMSSVLLPQMVPMELVSAEQMTNDQYVYEFFRETLELPHAAAAGLMANVDQECKFDPTASWTDVNGLTSYGLMQWNGARFEQLKAFCAENGYGYDTLEGQLAFLQYELNGAYSGYYTYLRKGVEDSAEGAYEAAYFWAERYEVCLTKYFERRAVLARDYYYPAYLDYTASAPSVFSDVLYVTLSQKESGNFLTDLGSEFSLAAESGDGSQTWKLERQSEHGYVMTNCKTGRSLALGDEAAAQEDPMLWEFYEGDHGFQIRMQDSGQAVGSGIRNAKASTAVVRLPVSLQVSSGSEQQVFAVTEVQPAGKATLSVTAEAAPSIAKFTWDAPAHAEQYHLRIYQDSEVRGKPFYEQKNLETQEFSIGLPAGTYVAVLESSNRCGSVSSEPLHFTVAQQPAADLGSEFYAKVSWKEHTLYLTAANERAVVSVAPDYDTDQLWKFVRNPEDGSYSIYSGTTQERAVTVQGTAVNTVTAADAASQRWFLYGDPAHGYVMQSADNARILTASEDVSFQTRMYEASEQQKLAVEPYAMGTPTLEHDVSGGIYEPVKLTWEPLDCAAQCLLEIKGENGLVVETKLLEGSACAYETMLAQGRYTATLSAVSAVDGTEAKSRTIRLVVKELPERPVVHLALYDAPGKMQISWNDCALAERYTYTVCDAVTEAVKIRGTSQERRAVPVTLPAGSYTLVVQAENAQGSISSVPMPITVTAQENGSTELSLRSLVQAHKAFAAAEETN